MKLFYGSALIVGLCIQFIVIGYDICFLLFSFKICQIFYIDIDFSVAQNKMGLLLAG